ncbi:DUF6508 domain-containing protein [Bacillaceae bacterium S4-13-56]
MFTKEQITEHINYFNDNRIKFVKWKSGEKKEDGVLTIGYPIYDEGFRKFVDDCYKADVLDGNYLHNVEKVCEENLIPMNYIESADKDLLQSILTYYIRQERFCEGLWATAIEKKVFLRILVRLEELLGK